MAQVENEVEVRVIKLSQSAFSQESERLVFVDKKQDMFICAVVSSCSKSIKYPLYKIGTQVDSFAWNSNCDILAYISDSKIVACYYPSAPFIDVRLMDTTKESFDVLACDSGARILSFYGSRIILMRQDNTVLEVSLQQDPSPLYANAVKGEWADAQRLCRFNESVQMWATLACLALQYQDWDTAEFAMSKNLEVDKLAQIRRIQAMPCGEVSEK